MALIGPDGRPIATPQDKALNGLAMHFDNLRNVVVHINIVIDFIIERVNKRAEEQGLGPTIDMTLYKEFATEKLQLIDAMIKAQNEEAAKKGGSVQ